MHAVTPQTPEDLAAALADAASKKQTITLAGRRAFRREDRHYRPYLRPELRTQRSHRQRPGRVRALAFSPDGKMLACGAGLRIVFWDIERRHRESQPGRARMETANRRQPALLEVVPVIKEAWRGHMCLLRRDSSRRSFEVFDRIVKDPPDQSGAGCHPAADWQSASWS